MERVSILPYFEYDETEIMHLYKSVGWSNYYERPEMLRKAFANSLCTLGAYSGGKLVGIIRVVGDGHSIIYVQDLLILPEYQHTGIGTRLLSAILEKFGNVYQKILVTDRTEKTVSFYESLGFTELTEIGCVAFLHSANSPAPLT
jgi:ribosomal protein S18 acetylase RimI-like enzyme